MTTHVNAFSGGTGEPATDIPLAGPSGVRPADPATHRRCRARALRGPGLRRHDDRRGRRGRRGQPAHGLPLGRLQGRPAEDRVGLGAWSATTSRWPMPTGPTSLAMQEVTDPEVLVRLWVDQVLEVAHRLAPSRSCSTGPSTPTPRRPTLRAGSTSSGAGGALMFVTHLASSGRAPRRPLRRRGGRHVLDPDEPAAPGAAARRPGLDPRGGRRTGWSGWPPPRSSPSPRPRPRVTVMTQTRWEQARAQELAEGHRGYGPTSPS